MKMKGKNNKKGNNKKQARRRRRNPINSTAYALKTAPICMGPGTTMVRVTSTYQYVATQAGSVVQPIMKDAFEEAEFERNAVSFNFCRVIGVKVIIPPRFILEPDYKPNGRLCLDWTSSVTENESNSDSAKEFFQYSTRPRVFKFLPPNSNLQSGARWINYRQWWSMNNISGFVPAGWLKITCAFTFNFTVEVLVQFKGSKFVSAVSTLKKLISVPLQKKEEKEEEKEDEKEEEDPFDEKNVGPKDKVLKIRTNEKGNRQYLLYQDEVNFINKQNILKAPAIPPTAENILNGDLQKVDLKERIKYLKKKLKDLEDKDKEEEEKKEIKNEPESDNPVSSDN